jgi:drug/metabolite transporter (DMT)-like permease
MGSNKVSATKYALIQLHIAVFLWGFTGVLGSKINLNAYELVVYRVLFTLVILFIILLVQKKQLQVTRQKTLQWLFIGAIIGIHWVFFYGSIKQANASIALVCLSTSGIISALLEPLFFKTKINFVELGIAFIALLGMVVIYKFDTQYLVGLVLGIGAAALSVVFTMLNKKWTSTDYPLLVSFYHMIGGIIILLLCIPLYSYFFKTNLSWQISKDSFVYLLCLAIFCTVIAQALALQALKILSPFTVILSVNLEPVYGIILAFFVLKEYKQLSPQFFIGLGLIALSVALHIYLTYLNKKSK